MSACERSCRSGPRQRDGDEIGLQVPTHVRYERPAPDSVHPARRTESSPSQRGDRDCRPGRTAGLITAPLDDVEWVHYEQVSPEIDLAHGASRPPVPAAAARLRRSTRSPRSSRRSSRAASASSATSRGLPHAAVPAHQDHSRPPAGGGAPERVPDAGLRSAPHELGRRACRTAARVVPGGGTSGTRPGEQAGQRPPGRRRRSGARSAVGGRSPRSGPAGRGVVRPRGARQVAGVGPRVAAPGLPSRRSVPDQLSMEVPAHEGPRSDAVTSCPSASSSPARRRQGRRRSPDRESPRLSAAFPRSAPRSGAVARPGRPG